MLNETNRELEERSDKAAIDEMMIRTEVQMPASIYQEPYDALDIVDAYFERKAIAEQQAIEAKDWNDRYGY